jgi:hypothetical protein
MNACGFPGISGNSQKTHPEYREFEKQIISLQLVN